MPELQKPRRRYSKSRTDMVLVGCFAVIGYVLGWRDSSPIAETALTAAFLLIGAVIGVYQGIGHLDLRKTREGEQP